MSPDQCREARTILKWTRRELADTAGVTLWVVAAFEDGRDILPHYEIEIRAALEAVGIGFPLEIADGQVKPAGVTYSPRGRDQAR
jgi:predicted transcriptional regulator